jgi:hypothetical protein
MVLSIANVLHIQKLNQKGLKYSHEVECKQKRMYLSGLQVNNITNHRREFSIPFEPHFD